MLGGTIDTARLTPARTARSTSTSPSAVLGRHPRRGAIAVPRSLGPRLRPSPEYIPGSAAGATACAASPTPTTPAAVRRGRRAPRDARPEPSASGRSGGCRVALINRGEARQADSSLFAGASADWSQAQFIRRKQREHVGEIDLVLGSGLFAFQSSWTAGLTVGRPSPVVHYFVSGQGTQGSRRYTTRRRRRFELICIATRPVPHGPAPYPGPESVHRLSVGACRSRRGGRHSRSAARATGELLSLAPASLH